MKEHYQRIFNNDLRAFKFRTDEVESKFWSRVIKTKSCWKWIGSVSNGYGYFCVNRKAFKAHRLAYLYKKGPIKKGLILDHLCRNTVCVNPAHLEPVTIGENTKRGDTFIARNMAKTHCSKGHALTPDNIYRRPSQPGYRVCATCQKISNNRDKI